MEEEDLPSPSLYQPFPTATEPNSNVTQPQPANNLSPKS